MTPTAAHWHDGQINTGRTWRFCPDNEAGYFGERCRRIHHAVQSATKSPGTRANSRTFAVTKVAPRRRAWAAMR